MVNGPLCGAADLVLTFGGTEEHIAVAMVNGQWSMVNGIMRMLMPQCRPVTTDS